MEMIKFKLTKKIRESMKNHDMKKTNERFRKKIMER